MNTLREWGLAGAVVYGLLLEAFMAVTLLMALGWWARRGVRWIRWRVTRKRRRAQFRAHIVREARRAPVSLEAREDDVEHARLLRVMGRPW